MLGLATLDLGKSHVDRATGGGGDRDRGSSSPSQVAIMASIIAVLIAIPLGTIAALFRDTWIDHTVRVVAIAGLAIPSFWLGMLIMMALLSLFNWLPRSATPLYVDPITNLSLTVWPPPRSATATPRWRRA